MVIKMEDTGILRRIDDLGRIVVPKALREKYEIKEGDPMHFFIDNEGNIILKKYKPSVDEIYNTLENYPLDEAIQYCRDELGFNYSLIMECVIKFSKRQIEGLKVAEEERTEDDE